MRRIDASEKVPDAGARRASSEDADDVVFAQDQELVSVHFTSVPA